MKRVFEWLVPNFFCRAHLEGRESLEISIFNSPFYKDITDARIMHIKSLGLPLSGKTLIDTGCGIGHFSDFLAKEGCQTFCVDGREENIRQLRNVYPKLNAEVVDLETSQILNYGKFDIVFCYGLLYHLADPFGFIKNAFKICNEMMLIETCITDSEFPVLRLLSEPKLNPTQAVSGMGCRPSPSYIVNCLKLAGFAYVYSPINLPRHKQFHYKRTNDFSCLKDGDLIRDVFLASHREIENDNFRAL